MLAVYVLNGKLKLSSVAALETCKLRVFAQKSQFF